MLTHPAPTRPRHSRTADRPELGAVHESKHDGHWLIAYVDRGAAHLLTRNGNNHSAIRPVGYYD
jgi:ATP-dependent DNA ligase